MDTLLFLWVANLAATMYLGFAMVSFVCQSEAVLALCSSPGICLSQLYCVKSLSACDCAFRRLQCKTSVGVKLRNHRTINVGKHIALLLWFGLVHGGDNCATGHIDHHGYVIDQD